MIIKKIKNWFKKTEDESFKALSLSSTQKFEIVLDSFTIGFLETSNGKWKFYYSNEFKTHSKFDHIPGFSNLEKIYVSDTLWPFFKIRIPGLGQPIIKNTITSEKISIDDEIALLKRFGKKSISNPYLLNPVE